MAEPDGGPSAPAAPPQGEDAVLVAVQSALADQPGVLPVTRAMSFFGEHSLGWLAIAGIGAVLSKSRRRQWVAAGVGTFAAHAAAVVIKRIVRRTRPDHPAIAVNVGTPSKLSFPSAHATSTTAAAILIGRAAGLPPGVLPAVLVPPMALSRMVLGVHYPSDVATGVVVGAAVAKVTAVIASMAKPGAAGRRDVTAVIASTAKPGASTANPGRIGGNR